MITTTDDTLLTKNLQEASEQSRVERGAKYERFAPTPRCYIRQRIVCELTTGEQLECDDNAGGLARAAAWHHGREHEIRRVLVAVDMRTGDRLCVEDTNAGANLACGWIGEREKT